MSNCEVEVLVQNTIIDVTPQAPVIDVAATVATIDAAKQEFTIDVGVQATKIVDVAVNNPIIELSANQILNIELENAPTLIATFPAGVSMNAYTVVAVVNGVLFPASIFDVTQQFSPVGILLADVNIGLPGTIAMSGIVTNGAWSWTINQAVFVGDNGTLVQTPLPLATWVIYVGRVISPTQLLLNVRDTVNISI